MAENEIGCPIHTNAARCMLSGCIAYRYDGVSALSATTAPTPVELRQKADYMETTAFYLSDSERASELHAEARTLREEAERIESAPTPVGNEQVDEIRKDQDYYRHVLSHSGGSASESIAKTMLRHIDYLLTSLSQAEARLRETQIALGMLTGQVERVDEQYFKNERLREQVAELTAQVESKAIVRENGSFTPAVYKHVLVAGRCGVSGHFRFQENGGNCLMCQQVESVRRETWQPIETAPKDGSAVLLLSVPYEMDAGPNGIHQIPAKVAIGHWHAEGTSWVDELGRIGGEAYTLAVTGVWFSGGGWFQPNEVSHWMLLPSPPEAAAAEGSK